MRHPKRKIAFGLSALVILLGLLFIHFYLPRFITEIKNPLIQLLRPQYALKGKPLFIEEGHTGKFIQFSSFDNLKMSAFISYSKTDSIKGSIILLHGIRASKEAFRGLSNKLAHEGYNTIALDLRAHGDSGGKHCTFGVKERQDVKALIDVLSKDSNAHKHIGIWGQSLGGAIALQAMASDDRIKFAIIESTFSDFRTITHDYINFHGGFNINPFTNYLVTRSAKIAGFDPDDARPIKYCEKISQPVLLAHGAQDKRINISYAKENFEKIPSSEKVFHTIENATHLDLWKTGGENYFEFVLNFIESNSR